MLKKNIKSSRSHVYALKEYIYLIQILRFTSHIVYINDTRYNNSWIMRDIKYAVY